MQPPSILYCGDTTLDSAASYLAGLMSRAGWSYHYLSSDLPLTIDLWNSLNGPTNLKLVIFSDYPALRVNEAVQNAILSHVEQGCGLLMLGGWESFHGCGGDWSDTPIGNSLPIEIASTDDRQNVDQPVFVQPYKSDIQPLHPVISGFPWSTRPPLIGGYNRFTPKRDAEQLLMADRYQAVVEESSSISTGAGSTVSLQRLGSDPLLVLGRHGEGITAALATDVAPHWVGPLVDWGTNRVTAQATGAPTIEVGDLYAEFFTRLLRHVGSLL